MYISVGFNILTETSMWHVIQLICYIQVILCALYTGDILCVVYRWYFVCYIQVICCVLYTGDILCVVYR